MHRRPAAGCVPIPRTAAIAAVFASTADGPLDSPQDYYTTRIPQITFCRFGETGSE